MVAQKWFISIGLEIHAQVLSESKLFSSSRNCVDSSQCEPNTCLDWLDYGLMGALPVLNEKCVHQAVKTSLGINAGVNPMSQFDRKNYFYPDLPSGYQITQHYIPLAEHGYLYINGSSGSEGTKKQVNIRSLHLEQDAGKLLHEYQDRNTSAVDLNRCGVPLMEIVTEPDMVDAEEVVSFVKLLRSVLRYLGTCDGDMQNGSLRVDANVSVSPEPGKLGVRVEVKNINSFKFLKQAINYEIERQIQMLKQGQKVEQQTRLFDEKSCKTYAMREKDDRHGYRYFYDPDLPSLHIPKELVEEIRKTLPELPQEKAKRFQKQYGLPRETSEILVQDQQLADFYELILQHCDDSMLVSNWLLSVAIGLLNKHNMSCGSIMHKADQFGVLMKMLTQKKLTTSSGKQAMDILILHGGLAEEIVHRHDLLSMSSEDELRGIMRQIIEKEPDNWTKLIDGQERLKKWFIGQVMYITRGRADPDVVYQILDDLIESEI